MANKKTTILIFVIFGVLLIAVAVLAFLPHNVADNPPGTVGNTAGNLNNKGLFCESDGIIYFANAYEDGALYSMKPDTSDIRKVSDAKVEFICAGGKYLYYYQLSSAASSGLGSVRSMSGIYRAPKKGGRSTCISSDPVSAMNLIGDYLYYQHYDVASNTTFYRSKTDKSDTSFLTELLINPACVENGLIYYSGYEKDHFLYTYDTNSGNISTLWDYDLWNPVLQNGTVYYMDVHHNYALCSCNLNTMEITTLTTDRVDYFNVYGNVIYYQVSSTDSPALMRMNLDGSQAELVATGVYENINTTSQYTFFSQFGSPVPMYMTPTTGPVSVTTFDAASAAAIENS